MSKIQMRELDRRTVSVAIRAAAGNTVMKGEAFYDAISEFGPQLRVLVAEPAGDFEMVLHERDWNGTFAAGQSFDVDYLILLDAGCEPGRPGRD